METHPDSHHHIIHMHRNKSVLQIILISSLQFSPQWVWTPTAMPSTVQVRVSVRNSLPHPISSPLLTFTTISLHLFSQTLTILPSKSSPLHHLFPNQLTEYSTTTAVSVPPRLTQFHHLSYHIVCLLPSISLRL